MDSQLSGTHRKIYQRIFQHPMSRNLGWREVCSMLDAMADVETIQDQQGNLKVMRNGQMLLLHRPRDKDFTEQNELMQLRSFLERPGTTATSPSPIGTHLLVVIDHRQARIYSTELHGSIPERIMPYDPFGFGRDLHYNQDDSNGQRKPEPKAFYEAVAKTLQGAKQILLFGSGTGASSAMDHLLLHLKEHYHNVADRVVGSIVVDEHHLTENQLLAKAREVFTAI